MSTKNKTCIDLNLLLQQEELYWRQRSRVSWLKDGNRNTKFFHASASHRQCINSISRLKDDTSAWVENESSLDTLAQQYFFTLFTSSQLGSITQVIQHVNRVVSQDMNDYLLQDFTVEDVHNALM